jgi:hypothetical protein
MSRQQLLHLQQSTLLISGLSILLLLSGCGIPGIGRQISSATDKTVAVLDNAIGDLASANADWEQILNKALEDLPDEVQSTVGFEVSRTLNRAISASGSEVKCIIDFLHDRAREDLIRIKAEFLDQPIPPLTPVLCDVESVDFALVQDGRQSSIVFFGYNFDVTNPVQVILIDGGQEINVNQQKQTLFVLTHYKMELILGSNNGLPLTPASQSLSVRWQDQVMSEIPIKQPVLPACDITEWKFTPSNEVSYRPPKTEGDGDFSGNGPNVRIFVKLHPRDLAGSDWDLEIFMRARETESDWTTASGSQFIEHFMQIPQGYVVNKVITPLENEGVYTDDDHEDDTIFPTGLGPANHFVVIGDTDGGEAGTQTQVTVFFNTIEFEIRQIDDCR